MRLKFCAFLLFLISFQSSLIAQTLKKEKQFSEHKTLPFYGFKKKGNTPVFQGNKEKKNYFEGWYFKMVAIDGQSVMSIIPGISLSENGDNQHAFIQFINGKTAETYYYTFPIEDFYFSRKAFAVRIGANYFSEDSIVLNIDDGKQKLTGTVHFSNQTPYKLKYRQPAIMGWYRFVPFMQCYHGVVSLTHSLSGNISVGSTDHSFNKGKGYIEKDWGESMPEAWVWMQSNNFNNTNTSFMLSIANIPWLGQSFTGFLGFLYYNGKVIRFATYTKSELDISYLKTNGIQLAIKNKKETIYINAKSKQSGLLKAPVKGAMDRRIVESIDAFIDIMLVNNSGDTIFSDASQISGLELVGDLNLLIKTQKQQ